MGKIDFGNTETNAQFFYTLVRGEGSGFSDEEIDGAQADGLTDGPSPAISDVVGPKDNKIQGREAIAVAFNQLVPNSLHPQYYQKIVEHFKPLGLDVGKMLTENGSIKPEFVTQILKQLSSPGRGHHNQALNYQTAKFYVAQTKQLSPFDPAFSKELSAFLVDKRFHEKIQGLLRDPNSVGLYAQWLFRYSEFSLLPYQNQLDALKEQLGWNKFPMGDSDINDNKRIESLAKNALSPLWQNRSLPKLVSQAALLLGLELETQAETLSPQDAKNKTAVARLLFRAAVELDNQNPLARRRLAIYLMREGNLPAASFHLAEAVRNEGGLPYLLEIVHGLEKNDPRLLDGAPDAWFFVVENLAEARRYAEAAALLHEAAKAATVRGDPAAVEIYLCKARDYEPKNSAWSRELGDFYRTQKDYRKAADSYEAAFTASGGTDLAAKRGAAEVYFGLGEFKNSREAYTVVLEEKDSKNSRDATLRKLRIEANQRYLDSLAPEKDSDEIQKTQAELDADNAMVLALGAKAKMADLVDLEKGLSPLHQESVDADMVAKLAKIELPGVSKKDILAGLEKLGSDYLQLAEQKYADPKDVAYVSSELNGLAAATFAMLSRFAKDEEKNDFKVYQRGGLYQGQQLLAEAKQLLAKDESLTEADHLLAMSKIDEAMQGFERIRNPVSEANAILERVKNEKLRMANLAGLDVWEAYYKESAKLEDDHLKGIRGRFDTKAAARTAERATEETLIAALKSRLGDSQAFSLRQALGQISEDSRSSQAVRDRAIFYLQDGDYATSGHPIGAIIHFVDRLTPGPEDASRLMKKGWEFECNDSAVQTPFAIYWLVHDMTPDPQLKRQAGEHMAALQGHSGFGRAAQKFFVSSLGSADLWDVGLILGAAGFGNLLKLGLLRRWEKTGFIGYKAINAVVLAEAAGIGAETTILWSGNTLREAWDHGGGEEGATRHLLRGFLTTLAMVGVSRATVKLSKTWGPELAKKRGWVIEGGTKLMFKGKLLVWGMGHTAGLGGVGAIGFANRALGPEPPGGWKEGVTHDLLSYLKLALAQGGADYVVDKVFRVNLGEVGQRRRSEIAYHEAVLLTKRLGFLTPRYKVNIGQDGSVVSVDGENFGSWDPVFQAAVEKKLGPNRKPGDQTLFLDHPQRELLVELFAKASLNRPGFAGRKLDKWIAAKEYQKANAYLQENGLSELTINKYGEVIVGSPDGSPHAARGIEPSPQPIPRPDDSVQPDPVIEMDPLTSPSQPAFDPEVLAFQDALVCRAEPVPSPDGAFADKPVTAFLRGQMSRVSGKAAAGNNSGIVLPADSRPDPALAGSPASSALDAPPRTPGKPPPTPSPRLKPVAPASAGAIYSNFARQHIFQFFRWRNDRNIRGYYARQMLEMIGFTHSPDGTPEGKYKFGTGFEKLLNEVTTLQDPAAKDNAEQKLAAICKSLEDAETLVPEYNLIQEGAELRKDGADPLNYLQQKGEELIANGLGDAGKKLKLQAIEALSAWHELRTLENEARDAGDDLRRTVPAKARNRGNPDYSNYLNKWRRWEAAINKIKAAKQAAQEIRDEEHTQPRSRPIKP